MTEKTLKHKTETHLRQFPLCEKYGLKVVRRRHDEKDVFRGYSDFTFADDVEQALSRLENRNAELEITAKLNNGRIEGYKEKIKTLEKANELMKRTNRLFAEKIKSLEAENSKLKDELGYGRSARLASPAMLREEIAELKAELKTAKLQGKQELVELALKYIRFTRANPDDIEAWLKSQIKDVKND